MAAPDEAFLGRDATDVVRILPDEIGVQVVQRVAHLVRVLLIYAEDDSLGEAVGLFQEIGQVASDGLRAGTQGHHPLEILGLVLVVRDRSSVAVEIARAGAPAGGVVGRDNPVDAVGREETIVYALAQAVGVDRIPEVAIGVAALFSQRRGRHTELIGGLEVF